MRYKENFLYERELLIKELIGNEKIKNRALCFIGLPFDKFYTGLAQHMWILGIKKDLPIYYDNRTWVGTKGKLIKNYLKFERKKNELRLISENPAKLWFITTGEMIIGKLIVNKIVEKRISDMTLIINEKYLKGDNTFIYWDYRKNRFLVLK
ncbi:MAG: hypothetical protein ACTSUG_00540 [Candidatus Helarchaeota archaeon]